MLEPIAIAALLLIMLTLAEIVIPAAAANDRGYNDDQSRTQAFVISDFSLH